MSMNQSNIQTFLARGNGRNVVRIETDYAIALGRTPSKLATMLRNEPEHITGGYGFSGNSQKAKAHAGALRALVREKKVKIKVFSEKGKLPSIIVVKGRDTAEEAPKRKYTRRTPEQIEAAPKKRKYVRRTPEEIAADKARPRRAYRRRNTSVTAAPVEPVQPTQVVQPVEQVVQPVQPVEQVINIPQPENVNVSVVPAPAPAETHPGA